MNLSRFFIDRPIFAGVVSFAIFLAGLISMFQLPISEYPEVVPPTIQVTAQFPGANPKVISEEIGMLQASTKANRISAMYPACVRKLST